MSDAHAPPQGSETKRSNATRVGCSCGWRGRRVMGECCCYDEYAWYCACRWGHCPKCNGRVSTMETIKQYRRIDREVSHV